MADETMEMNCRYFEIIHFLTEVIIRIQPPQALLSAKCSKRSGEGQNNITVPEVISAQEILCNPIQYWVPPSAVFDNN